MGPALFHRHPDHVLYELVSAVRDERLPVTQGIGILIFPADGLQSGFCDLVEVQGLFHQLISLDELDGRPVGGQPHRIGSVMDQLPHPMMDLVGIVVVEVVGLYRNSHVHLLMSDAEHLPHILTRAGRDRDDRYAKGLGEPCHIDLIPVLLHLVHKVERNDHRPLQLQKLGREIQIALDVGGVYNIDDGVGFFSHDEIPGHDLLHGVGRERVDARQVHNGDILTVYLSPALFFLHRNTGPVAHILVGPGQRIKERGLAAIGVSH